MEDVQNVCADRLLPDALRRAGLLGEHPVWLAAQDPTALESKVPQALWKLLIHFP